MFVVSGQCFLISPFFSHGESFIMKSRWMRGAVSRLVQNTRRSGVPAVQHPVDNSAASATSRLAATTRKQYKVLTASKYSATRFTAGVACFIAIRKVALSEEYCFFPLLGRASSATFPRSGNSQQFTVSEKKNAAITCSLLNRPQVDIVPRRLSRTV